MTWTGRVGGHKLGPRVGANTYHPPATRVHPPGWNSHGSPQMALVKSSSVPGMPRDGTRSDGELPAHDNTCLIATGGLVPSDCPKLSLAGGQKKVLGDNSGNPEPRLGPGTPPCPEQLHLSPLFALEHARCCPLATTALPAAQSRKIHWISGTRFSDEVSSQWLAKGEPSLTHGYYKIKSNVTAGFRHKTPRLKIGS